MRPITEAFRDTELRIMANWMSVSDAADRLGMQGRQVRNLIAHSDLDAERLGRAWMVSRASVDDYRRLSVRAGRPLAAESAWWVLAAVDAAIHNDREPAELPNDRRARYRLRRILAAPPEVEHWASWLRSRALRRSVWFHPGAAGRIESDDRVERSDLSAELGLAVHDLGALYVSEDDFEDFVARHHGQIVEGIGSPDARPVMIVPLFPEAISWRSHVAASALVDLSVSPDARVRRAALGRLADAAAELRSEARRAGERP